LSSYLKKDYKSIKADYLNYVEITSEISEKLKLVGSDFEEMVSFSNYEAHFDKNP